MALLHIFMYYLISLCSMSLFPPRDTHCSKNYLVTKTMTTITKLGELMRLLNINLKYDLLLHLLPSIIFTRFNFLLLIFFSSVSYKKQRSAKLFRRASTPWLPDNNVTSQTVTRWPSWAPPWPSAGRENWWVAGWRVTEGKGKGYGRLSEGKKFDTFGR